VTRASLLLALLLPSLAAAEDLLEARVLAAKDKVFPALVHIVNVEEGFMLGRKQKSVSTGSGFFVDAQGHVVTNYHVAGEGKLLVVRAVSRGRGEARRGRPLHRPRGAEVDRRRPSRQEAGCEFGDSRGWRAIRDGSPLRCAPVSFDHLLPRAHARPLECGPRERNSTA
jgi:S1-C subfamily serine protease